MDCEALRQLPRPLGAKQGFICAATPLRTDHRSHVVYSDRGDIPLDRKLVRDMSCSHAHPGLCCTDDEAIYHRVLSMADHIEHALSSSHVSQYFRFVSPDTGTKEVVYFARRRQRRAYAWQTHILARCYESPCAADWYADDRCDSRSYGLDFVTCGHANRSLCTVWEVILASAFLPVLFYRV